IWLESELCRGAIPSFGTRRMYGTNTKAAPATQPQSSGAGPSGDEDLLLLARRLNREFNAPVGLLDPVGGSWQVRIGAVSEAFPQASPGLLTELTTSGLGLKRAVVWHPERNGNGPDEVVWLGMALPRGAGSHWLALTGFAASAA